MMDWYFHFLITFMFFLSAAIKSRDIALLTKVCIVKAMVFPVVMYGCMGVWTIKKTWTPKNWCFQTGVLKTLESPLGSKEIKPVNLKGNQSWIFTGRTNAETEAPILWLPYVKSQLIGKDPDAGKDWGQEEKWAVEDEMFGWHHCFNGHEFEQTLGNSEGQGSLACCSPWGHKELNTIEQRRWTTQLLISMRIKRHYASKMKDFLKTGLGSGNAV